MKLTGAEQFWIYGVLIVVKGVVMYSVAKRSLGTLSLWFAIGLGIALVPTLVNPAPAASQAPSQSSSQAPDAPIAPSSAIEPLPGEPLPPLLSHPLPIAPTSTPPAIQPPSISPNGVSGIPLSVSASMSVPGNVIHLAFPPAVPQPTPAGSPQGIPQVAPPGVPQIAPPVTPPVTPPGTQPPNGIPDGQPIQTQPMETPIRLVIQRSKRRVTVYQGDKVLASYPIAVGKPGWETPVGSFQVINMEENPTFKSFKTGRIIKPGPENPLGVRWIGIWTDGKTQLGFHGTNEPELIGSAVSHGCIRMHNKDVIALYRYVKLGTAVTIKP